MRHRSPNKQLPHGVGRVVWLHMGRIEPSYLAADLAVTYPDRCGRLPSTRRPKEVVGPIRRKDGESG